MTMFKTSKALPRRTRRRLAGALALAVALSTSAITAFADQPTADEPGIPAGANFASWTDNGQDGQIVLQRFTGDMPIAGAVVAEAVKNDTNCAPDALGLSHCHNVIALVDGGAIEAIHVHAMGRHPCLFPGQRLSISRLDGDWLVVTPSK